MLILFAECFLVGFIYFKVARRIGGALKFSEGFLKFIKRFKKDSKKM